MWYSHISLARPSVVTGRLHRVGTGVWRGISVSAQSQDKRLKCTADEDRKLLELYDKFTKSGRHSWRGDISSELGTRSPKAVEYRVRQLTITSGLPPSAARWSSKEEELIQEMRRQGHVAAEITKHLPGRSFRSVAARMWVLSHNVKTNSLGNQRRAPVRRVWSDADLRRMIEMKLVEHKSEMEVATEFNMSYKSMRGLWERRCRELLSQADRESLRAQRHWTPAEVYHVTELYTRTKISIRDLALHLPSKTYAAVNQMITRSQLRVARKKHQAESRRKAYVASPASHRKAGQKMMSCEQRRAFSSCSDGFLNHRRWTANTILEPVSRWENRHTLCRYELRRAFSSSSCDFDKLRKWTASEDKELLGLAQQGLKIRDISTKLGRSVVALQARQDTLKAGLHTKRGQWSAEEDAIFLEQRQKGLTLKEVAKCIPGRGLAATKERSRILSNSEMTTTRMGSFQWTDADAHCVIKMRVEERMTLSEIATKLRCHDNRIRSLWYRRCAQLVSDEDLHIVDGPGRNSWTSNELDHLESMFRQGKRPKEIMPYFPSRTASAIYNMLSRKLHLWKDSPKGT